MKSRLSVLSLVVLAAGVASADVTSYTGTLASPEDTADFTVTLTTAGLVTLQTYGFGGGINATGTVIMPGGTDPFLAIFSETGAGASIVTDGIGNPFGTSLDLTNYGNPDFLGCPPARTPLIGGSHVCGDSTMSLSLPKGTYTVVLSDGQYIANAEFDNGTLGEGFTDLTGGAFCNLAINGVACPNTSGAYALDITTPGSAVPEPSAIGPLSTALAALGLLYRRRRNPAAGQNR
ncbi:MAG: DVUA0089 family protein [Acidobacteriia bacterium]|nr:DVUA0089 family protein [Terriglobia bacterium]MBV8906192.1 DVUA0089 family protein [Terriglobia bacterium]